MKKTSKRLFFLITSILVLTMTAVPSFGNTPVRADIIWYNGNVISMDKSNGVYEAVAVKGDKILAVGSTRQIKKLAGSATVQHDLKGKTIIPGMIDTHSHFLRYGLTFFQIRGDKKQKQVILNEVKQKANATDGNLWIRGTGWNHMQWETPVLPTAKDLDAVSGGNPVILMRADNHCLWVNSKALELAGITKNTPDPEGGKIIRDKNGNPTGILIDSAMNLVKKIVPDWSKAEIEKAYIMADTMYSKVGLTTLHDGGELTDFEVLKKLISEGKVNTRIYALLDVYQTPKFFDQGIRPEIGLYNNHLTIRAIKIKSDGGVGSRGALMFSDYSDAPGVVGSCLVPKEEIKKLCRRALDLGYQVSTHAIGDKSNRIALDAYEEIFKERSLVGNPERFNIVHAQVVSMGDIPRFGQLKVPAIINPSFVQTGFNMAAIRLGPWRILGAYAYRSLADHGTFLSAGADSPNDILEPIFGMYSAITRTDKNSLPTGGWYPAERLTRQEALELYTTHGAWIGFEENLKGSLEKGKLADMVILSDNIMTMPTKDIWKCTPVNTIIGGKIIYTAK